MKIDLCIMTKNEEKTIVRCIESAKQLVNKIIVVDTGSEDKTVQLAEEQGAEVFFYEWINDFSAARNFTLMKSRADWIIFLDADEYLGKIEKKVIMKHIKAAEKLDRDALLVTLINIEQSTGQIQSTTQSIRLLKNRPSLRYVGMIHERPEHSSREIRYHFAADDIKVFHTGYSSMLIQEKQKDQRNLKLLYKELEKKPDDTDVHFYLVESLQLAGNMKEALKHTYEVERLGQGKTSGVLIKNQYHRMTCMNGLGYGCKTIEEEYRRAVALDSMFPDYELAMAECYIRDNKTLEAIKCLENTIVKAEQYNSDIESWVLGNLGNIFLVVSKVYLLADKKQLAVTKLAQLLQADKYCYEALLLLLGILVKTESPNNIVHFIFKIYDETLTKDKMYLLYACREIAEAVCVYELIYERLSEEEKIAYDQVEK